MEAKLILEDGTVYVGKSVGAPGTVCGKVVFTTIMSGFQESLTDPAYSGEILAFTDPIVDNYGVNGEDDESGAVSCRGVIMKDPSFTPSNFRCTGTMPDYLAARGVVGIYDIDTRSLTRKLRDCGTLKGVITTEKADVKQLFAQKTESLPAMKVGVQHTSKIIAENEKASVVIVDLGVKQSIVDGFVAKGYTVTRMPATASPASILASAPDGILISNGPGSAEAYPELVSLCAEIVKSGVPTLAVGLGNLLVALSQGFEVVPMKFGHHGNHPVKDLARDFVFTAAHNVNQTILAASVRADAAEISHIDMHDGTVEGVRLTKAPVLCLQFQPEFAHSDHNSSYLFETFETMMKECKKK